jgi:hypothetical protein
VLSTPLLPKPRHSLAIAALACSVVVMHARGASYWDSALRCAAINIGMGRLVSLVEGELDTISGIRATALQ